MLAGNEMVDEEYEFKANLGNLMQHWVLCETLDGLKRSLKTNQSSLFYFDAHSMAPFSRPDDSNTYSRGRFLTVQKKLPGRRSIFELTWYELQKDNQGLYPSSVLFLNHLWKIRWKRPLNLFLCEKHDGKSR